MSEKRVSLAGKITVLLEKLDDLHAPIRQPRPSEYQFACGQAALLIREMRNGQDKLERLTAQREASILQWDNYHAQLMELQAARDRLRDEFRTERAALRLYGRHHQGCPGLGENPCSCGFIQALAGANAPKKVTHE